ncbi:MAG TPA: response regulator transcription factor [Anaerolineales bacterium]|nr:response regulator transcription factor [Anaerolineales bacterium]
MITILLVDDNGPVRKSLRSLLEGADDMQVVATAKDGADAVEKAHSLRPNIAVMDISMPIMDGIQATEHIRECCRLTRVIILSGFDDSEYIKHALDVGAKGYVLKDRAGQDLLKAIRTIQQGGHYFSEKIADIGTNHLAQQEKDNV